MKRLPVIILGETVHLLGLWGVLGDRSTAYCCVFLEIGCWAKFRAAGSSFASMQSHQWHTVAMASIATANRSN
eukprot:981754-Amphidinium_carterae.1